MYCVYIIKSISTNRYYTGYTSDLERRIEEHNQGKTASIKNQVPFIVVHNEFYPTRKEAYRRERQIKSYKGGNAFLKLITK